MSLSVQACDVWATRAARTYESFMGACEAIGMVRWKGGTWGAHQKKEWTLC